MKTKIIYEPAGRAREYAPLAANLYRGCEHGCVYCYAPRALRRKKEEFHQRGKERTNVFADFEKDCKILAGSKIPVLFSFTTDPYQPCEQEIKLSRRAIGIMKNYNMIVHVLTKGGLRAARDFDLLGPEDAFATTLTFLNDTESRGWEPKAALPAERIEAIKIAHKRGINTWVSLEPVIDPEQSLEIIERTHKFVDLYKVGVLNYHERSKKIDWKDFGNQAVGLLIRLKKKFILKDDLKEKMV